MRDIQNNVSPKFIKLCTGRQQGVPLRSTKYRRRNQRTEISVVEFSYRCVNSSLEELMKIKVNYLFWDKECLDSKISKNQNVFKPNNQGQQGGRGGNGIPVYPKKIRQNTQKYPKCIQIYPKLYPGILYTWNSKKVIYRIPVFKLQYTIYPI